MGNEPLIDGVHPEPAVAVEREPVNPSTYSELSASIKGTLHPRGDPSFVLHSKLFNGDVISRASLLVRPFDAVDVSQIVQFCRRHSLSLSVKAGGYGTHGQAVQGDVIIDVSLLNDIHVEKINEQGGFTSIRDMPSSKNAGKGREISDDISDSDTRLCPPARDILSPPLAKRRADEAFDGDHPVNQHWPAFPLDFSSISFASGSGPSSLPALEQDGPHPKTRRRIWPPEDSSSGPQAGSSESVTIHHAVSPPSSGQKGEGFRQESSGSSSGEEGAGASGGSSRSDSGASLPSQGADSVSTSATSIDSTPLKPDSHDDPFGYMASQETSTPGQQDPFGYMATQDSATGGPPAPSPPSLNAPAAGVSQFHAQPGLSGSFSMDSLTSAGHYTPTRVTPIFPHAYFTFGAGAKQKDVDMHSASHPLPANSVEGTPCFTPYHVPFAAHPVGSSVMLLGGFGFLSRLHGLSIDNLVEVEMVLADGSIVVVNEENHADLWWAMRGAGPAFGIATRYKAKAYPVPVVYAGNLLYKFRRSTAASLIKHFRDCVKNVPRELYANVILTAGPDGDALLVIQICYLGTHEQGVEFLQAITSWDGEQCLLNEVSEKSFLNQQDSLAQLINGKAGRKWFIRSDLLNTLSDEAIHETVMRFADTPVGCTWLFELSGGNVSDEHGGCFPASRRQATWTIAAFHQWELDQDDPRCVSSAEDWIKDTLAPSSTGGLFPSFFGIHESSERVKGAYGENWQRLCEVKRKYDPAGFFRHNFWPLDHNDQPITTLVPTHTEF